MPLRRQVGTLLMISFSGTVAPPYVLDALRAGRAGGVVLFGGNVASPGQVRQLTASLRRAGGRDALVAIDQEGGSIRTLPFAYPVLSQAVQSGPAVAAAQARHAAADLRRAGVTVTLGPVADVASGPSSVVRSRAFPGSVGQVAASVAAAARAYRRGGVLPALKHYPGLGAATANTDRGPVDVGLSATALRAQAAPFRAAAAARGPSLVMLSHARYPALDPSHIASQSPAIIARLKRIDAPGAVVMTDSMEARAVTAHSTVGTAAVRSVRAGADLLLLTGPGSFRPVARALAAAARRSPALRARVRDAAARVLALRGWTRGG